MTKEEAIKWFKESPFYHKDHELFNMAIKALEQELNLDKIRAEIKALTSNRGFLSCDVDYIHEEIDAVFDKYMAESEDT